MLHFQAFYPSLHKKSRFPTSAEGLGFRGQRSQPMASNVVSEMSSKVAPMSHLPGYKYLIKACSGWLLRATGCFWFPAAASRKEAAEKPHRGSSLLFALLTTSFASPSGFTGFPPPPPLFFSLSLARSGAETAQTVRPQVPENHEMHKMVKHKNGNHSQPASVPSCSWFGKMLKGCSQTQGPSVKLIS